MQNIVLCPGLPRSGTTSLSRLIANDVYKEPQYLFGLYNFDSCYPELYPEEVIDTHVKFILNENRTILNLDTPYSFNDCLLYTSPSPRDS